MIFPDLRTSLVQALSRELHSGSVLLSVGLPGSGPIRVLERSRDGFATFEALSLPLLEAYPDYAESLLADRARPVLAERDGGGLLPFRLDLGPRIYREVTQRIFS